MNVISLSFLTQICLIFETLENEFEELGMEILTWGLLKFIVSLSWVRALEAQQHNSFGPKEYRLELLRLNGSIVAQQHNSFWPKEYRLELGA